MTSLHAQLLTAVIFKVVQLSSSLGVGREANISSP